VDGGGWRCFFFAFSSHAGARAGRRLLFSSAARPGEVAWLRQQHQLRWQSNVNKSSITRPMFRSVVRAGVRISPAVRALRVPQTPRAFVRAYSSDEETKRLEKLVSDLRTNPSIATALQDFQQLLVAKGFEPDKKPLMMQMMLILTDKEIKTAIGELKRELEAANVSFSQKDVDAFMKLFGMNMK
jgi:hypothetical protein